MQRGLVTMKLGFNRLLLDYTDLQGTPLPSLQQKI
jgi:hypothetical protein